MKNKFWGVSLCAAILLTGCAPVSEQPPEEEQQTRYDYSEKFISPVYEALSDYEKSLYDKILSAVLGFEDSVSFDEPVPRDTARKIYKLVYSQERNYFWLSSMFYAPEDELELLQLKYVYEKEDAAKKSAELEETAAAIISELPEDASDLEKVIFFHDRIVTGCEFSQSEEHVNSSYGVLVSGYAQCEGYAAAMALLCDRAGIPNYIVCGTNENGETHAWNKVVVDGSWYNSDCTRDDPILKRDDPDFVRHDYCLISDTEINGITHFPDEVYQGIAPSTDTKNNYFTAKGLLFSTAAGAAESIREQIRSAGIAGKREAELRLSSEDVYYTVLSRFFDSGEIKRIIKEVNDTYGTEIRSAYKLTNEELYIVHISLIYESDSVEEA